MRRREFLGVLAGAAGAWPLAARAQQGGRVRHVGVLTPALAQSDPEAQTRIAAFLDTFQKLGWSDGRNVRVEHHWGAGDAERDKAIAADVVRSAPDVILTGTSPPVLAELQRLTTTIPIVFVQISDPVGGGFVASFSRPGRNITGFINFEATMGGKWLGVLKEAIPDMKRAAVLFGSDSVGNRSFLRAAEDVAPSLGIRITAVDLHEPTGIERAIEAFAGEPDGGMVVLPYPYTVLNREAVIQLAARHRLAAVYPYRFFATAGGLMSYGIDQVDQWRGAASYVDRILRGEMPGDLPVQAPTKFELVVNLKTAKALGLKIPPAFPLRADEVIE